MKLENYPNARISVSGRPKFLKRSAGFPELTKSQLAQIQKRLADSLDPTRYVIVASFGANYVLYFRVEDATFGSDVGHATLFKRPAMAEAVRKSFRSRRVAKTLQIVRVKKTKIRISLLEKVRSRR